MIINKRQILYKIVKPNKKMAREAKKEGYAEFSNKKREFKKEFYDHIVSRELLAGPLSNSNPTGTLGGRSGNLWALIGFPAGSRPVDELWDILDENIRFASFADTKIEQRNDVVLYRFRIRPPPLEELYSQTPYPEWGGGSWLRGIENGVPGLRYYLFSERVAQWSRSGMAIQAKNVVTGKLQVIREEPSRSSGIRYISELLENFKNKFA